ncbi:MAG: hypothetical protein WDN48_10890 [Pseudolabrys sp.]
MRARRNAAIRLLKTMMVASIALPLGLFSYASWVTYKNTFAHADEQLSATLDIMSEHANKVFQSVELSFASVRAIVGDLSDDEINASEQALHLKLRELDTALNSIDAIAIADKTACRWSRPPSFRSRRTSISPTAIFPGTDRTRRRHLYRRGRKAAGAAQNRCSASPSAGRCRPASLPALPWSLSCREYFRNSTTGCPAAPAPVSHW